MEGVKFWATTAVKQHEDFPENSLPQQDVDPRVQDLVPRSHAYSQQTKRRRLIRGSGTQNGDMDLLEW